MIKGVSRGRKFTWPLHCVFSLRSLKINPPPRNHFSENVRHASVLLTNEGVTGPNLRPESPGLDGDANVYTLPHHGSTSHPSWMFIFLLPSKPLHTKLLKWGLHTAFCHNINQMAERERHRHANWFRPSWSSVCTNTCSLYRHCRIKTATSCENNTLQIQHLSMKFRDWFNMSYTPHTDSGGKIAKTKKN
jgi:hypothetical protein